jgi:hypothetical protein
MPIFLGTEPLKPIHESASIVKFRTPQHTEGIFPRKKAPPLALHLCSYWVFWLFPIILLGICSRMIWRIPDSDR